MADIEIIDSLIKDIDNIGNFAEEQSNILNNLYKQLLDSFNCNLPEAIKEDNLLSEILETSEITEKTEILEIPEITEEDTLLSNKDDDINLLSEINKEDNLLSEEFDEDEDDEILLSEINKEDYE